MGFYEDLAEALDREGIESRVNDDILFVPIAPELEVQFHEIDAPGMAPSLAAANVFLASPDDDLEDDHEPAFVSVVFSVDAAVAEVAKHVTTDQIVTVLHDLLEGNDERVADLEFSQDPGEPLLVHAEVGTSSSLEVKLVAADTVPEAHVTFTTYGQEFEDIVDQAISEIWDDDSDVSEYDREVILRNVVFDAAETTSEVLELGTFTDFDQLFDVIAAAQVLAEQWEEMLVPLDDYFDEDDDFDSELDSELDPEFDDDFDVDEEDDDRDSGDWDNDDDEFEEEA